MDGRGRAAPGWPPALARRPPRGPLLRRAARCCAALACGGGGRGWRRPRRLAALAATARRGAEECTSCGGRGFEGVESGGAGRSGVGAPASAWPWGSRPGEGKWAGRAPPARRLAARGLVPAAADGRGGGGLPRGPGQGPAGRGAGGAPRCAVSGARRGAPAPPPLPPLPSPSGARPLAVPPAPAPTHPRIPVVVRPLDRTRALPAARAPRGPRRTSY
jgi:hypothetical protein